MRLINQNIKITVCLLLIGMQSAYSQNLSSFKNQKPFSISGSLSATTQFYVAEGIENRRRPFTWYLTGSPTIKLYGFSIPFSLTVSEQERSFSQPFNRYGASPTYKWIKLHLGYRNVRFSDFTLGGANFLGAGVELNPKNLRLGFVYGQFRRRVFEDSTGGLDPRIRYLRPVFQRLGYGAKLGFGKSRNFFDLSFFKGADVVNSIYTPTIRSGVTPMENLAIAAHSQVSILKNKLQFDANVGVSLLTRDTRIEALNTTDQWQKQVQRIIPINQSSTYFKALRGFGNYNSKWGRLRVDYQRIDPGFQSMGAYFFQNDIEQITLSPSLRILKNKMNLNASIGLSKDNLNGKKAQTNHRKVYAFNIALRPTNQFNANLAYSNFGLGQSRGLADFFNDSLSVSVVNSSYSGNVNYVLGNKSQKQTIGLNATLQNTRDYSQFSDQVNVNQSRMLSGNYSINIPSNNLNASVSLSVVNMVFSGREMFTMGPSFVTSKSWKKGKYRASINHNSQVRKTNAVNDGLVSNSGLQLHTNLDKHQTLGVGLNYLFNRYQYQEDGQRFRNFAEYRGQINYGLRFK